MPYLRGLLLSLATISLTICEAVNSEIKSPEARVWSVSQKFDIKDMQDFNQKGFKEMMDRVKLIVDHRYRQECLDSEMMSVEIEMAKVVSKSFEAVLRTLQTLQLLLGDVTQHFRDYPCTHKFGSNCTRDQFNCKSGECIRLNMYCDRKFDCKDNSDEPQNCMKFETISERSKCHPFQFSCETDGECIAGWWVCDGRTDCKDGTDERDCNVLECNSAQFQCRSLGVCIPINAKCDGIIDCMDGSDEASCQTRTTIVDIANVTLQVSKFTQVTPSYLTQASGVSNQTDCKGQFRCEENHVCIAIEKVCDRYTDCTDHSDEKNCPSTPITTTPISSTRILKDITPPFKDNNTCDDFHFFCEMKNRPICLPFDLHCDHIPDCDDGVDENNCEYPVTEEPDSDSAEITRDPYWDGYEEDEDDSNTLPIFFWPYGSVLETRSSQDGDAIPDSTPESFKRDLSKIYNTLSARQRVPVNETRSHGKHGMCRSSHFKCGSSGECHSLKRVCDGTKDCPDGSDEEHCSKEYVNILAGNLRNDSKHILPHIILLPTENGGCKSGWIFCNALQRDICIPLTWYCDGIENCDDGRDEKRCNMTIGSLIRNIQLDVSVSLSYANDVSEDQVTESPLPAGSSYPTVQSHEENETLLVHKPLPAGSSYPTVQSHEENKTLLVHNPLPAGSSYPTVQSHEENKTLLVHNPLPAGSSYPTVQSHEENKTLLVHNPLPAGRSYPTAESREEDNTPLDGNTWPARTSHPTSALSFDNTWPERNSHSKAQPHEEDNALYFIFNNLLKLESRGVMPYNKSYLTTTSPKTNIKTTDIFGGTTTEAGLDMVAPTTMFISPTPESGAVEKYIQGTTTDYFETSSASEPVENGATTQEAITMPRKTKFVATTTTETRAITTPSSSTTTTPSPTVSSTEGTTTLPWSSLATPAIWKHTVSTSVISSNALSSV
ncbi:hypothetical protein SK128_018107 [Halocaridina rubra]|uniref:Uncharacterized protein n=1 Tax=Halocaridina rubra TaxID=373956 RepID=A0AAN8WAW5_HALRR